MIESGAPARLRSERQRLGLNQIEFGKLGGVSKNTQLAYENGTSPIPLDYLVSLAAHGVDLIYVATGGSPRSDNEEQVADQHTRRRTSKDDLVELNEIDLRYGLGATYLDGPVLTEKRVFSRAWLRNFTSAAPQHLFWTIGDGDSMEPTIRSGEVILIDTSQKSPRMAEGIWAFALGEIGMVKRIHFPATDRIELLSDNKVVPPVSVAQDELHVVGRVVAVVRRL